MPDPGEAKVDDKVRARLLKQVRQLLPREVFVRAAGTLPGAAPQEVRVEGLRRAGARLAHVDEEMVQYCACQLGRMLTVMLTGVVPWHLRRRMPGVAVGSGGTAGLEAELAAERQKVARLEKELADVRARLPPPPQ